MCYPSQQAPPVPRRGANTHNTTHTQHNARVRASVCALIPLKGELLRCPRCANAAALVGRFLRSGACLPQPCAATGPSLRVPPLPRAHWARGRESPDGCFRVGLFVPQKALGRPSGRASSRRTSCKAGSARRTRQTRRARSTTRQAVRRLPSRSAARLKCRAWHGIYRIPPPGLRVRTCHGTAARRRIDRCRGNAAALSPQRAAEADALLRLKRVAVAGAAARGSATCADFHLLERGATDAARRHERADEEGWQAGCADGHILCHQELPAGAACASLFVRACARWCVRPCMTTTWFGV